MRAKHAHAYVFVCVWMDGWVDGWMDGCLPIVMFSFIQMRVQSRCTVPGRQTGYVNLCWFHDGAERAVSGMLGFLYGSGLHNGPGL